MKPSFKKKPPRGLVEVIRFVFRQRAAPEQIALGVSLGTVVAFSPTVGIQIPLVLLVSTVFKANRGAALLPIWLTNVFTIPPVYGLTYRIGHVFMPGREPQKVRQLLEVIRDRISSLGFYNLGEQFRAFGRLGADLFLPMVIGGLIVGIPAAALSYPIVLWTVRRYRRQRSLRLRARALGRRRFGPAQPPPADPSA